MKIPHALALIVIHLLAARGLLAAERTPVIINQAADAVVNYIAQKAHKAGKPLGNGTTKEMALGWLQQEVDQYEGTGVTHIFWNVNYQRVGYRSTVWPSYWDDPDPEKNVTDWPRSYYQLHRLGIDDVFSIVIPRSRERGISPWISLRMNDHHYLADPTRVSAFLFNHPELRIHGGKGLFNYAKPEVREHYLKLIAEVLERYDVDGLELDWIRTPYNFDSDMRERGRDIITEFVRTVRKKTEAAAQRRGHSVKLAVRVLTSPKFSHDQALDAAAWAREGLIDMIIPSDWWNGYADTPVEEWRAQMGPAAKACQICPSTAGTYACTKKGYMMSRNLAAMRGFAASVLDRGADGLYLFNHFDAVTNALRLRTPEGKSVQEGTVADFLRSAGDLQAAMSNPRLHVLGIHDCVPERTDYRPELPSKISGDKPAAFRLHMGPKSVGGLCIVRIGLDKADDLQGAKLAVKLNGVACQVMEDLPVPAKADSRPEQPRMNVCEVAPRVLQFAAPLSATQRGYNSVDLAVEKGGPQTVVWLEAVLDPTNSK